MSDQTLEQRLTALEAKVSEEVDRLYNAEFPSLDEQILKVSRRTNEVEIGARQQYDATLTEARAVLREIQAVAHDLKGAIASAIRNTVASLVGKAANDVVVSALKGSLKTTILITRPASREEARDGSALAVRQATAAEIKQQS